MAKKIISAYEKLVKIQDYSKKPQIAGVEVIELKNFVSEDGFLVEVSRINDQGKVEGLADFQLKQINFTKVLPRSIKAWHLHYNQDDLWYIPPDGQLTIGLADLREDSPTKEVKIKLVLGGGKSHLILIPSGVAHGYTNNTSEPLFVFYLINQQFSSEDPDERRLPWDSFGADFWEVKPG